MESGQLKSGSIDIFNLPTIFYQISNTPTTEHEMTLLPGDFFWKYYSKITRDILSHVTGYFSQIMSRLIFDVTG